jgi:hypothetical protein
MIWQMYFIIRFRGDALIEDGILYLVVCIPVVEEILSIDKQTKNNLDGKGITCAPGNQDGADASGHP